MARRAVALAIALGVSMLPVPAAAPSVGAAPNPAEDNLLRNPGFEQGVPNVASGWEVLATDDPYATVDVDSAVSFSGERAARIRCIATDPRVGKVHNGWYAELPATPLRGKTVTVRTLATTEGTAPGHAAKLRLEAWQTTYIELCIASVTVPVPCCQGSQWATGCAELEIPAEAEVVRVSVGLDGIGTAWFDDVSLIIGASCTCSTGEVYSHTPLRFGPFPQVSVRAVEEPQPPRGPAESKPWTIAVYDAADFQGLDPRDHIAHALRSCDQYNVVLFQDAHQGGAKTWLVEESGGEAVLRCLVDHGELDTSSEVTLAEFLGYCREWFPCERLMLLVYDHGGAWRGTARDDGDHPDRNGWLTPAEMRRALQEGQGVDALLFTAPCTMASLEAMSEIGEHAGLVIASEEYSGYVLWLRVLPRLGDRLRSAPGLCLEDLAGFVIHEMEGEQLAARGSSEAVPYVYFHMSALLGDRMGGLVGALDRLAAALLGLLPAHREQIVEIRNAAMAFRSGELVDLWDFARRCARLPGVGEAASALTGALDEAVLRVVGNPEFANSSGLTVFFPLFALYGDLRDEYEAAELLVVGQTRWDELLRGLYGEPEALP